MAEITDLSSITDDHITEDELKGVLKKIDVAIVNLISGYGTFGSVPYNEGGPGGHSSDPTKTLDSLRRMRNMYLQLLTQPELRGDVSILRSQFDDPAL